MQKLVVHNFGPIQTAELEISRFMVLIGPQASGKSTLTKAVYFFKLLRDELLTFIMDQMDQEKEAKIGDFGRVVRTRFVDFWGSSFHLDNLFLHYRYRDGITLEIALSKPDRYVNPTFSKGFVSGFLNVLRYARSNSPQDAQLNSLANWDEKMFRRRLVEMINDLFGFDHDLFFIPAGRSLVTALSDQIIKVEQRNLEFVIRAFIDHVVRARRFFSKSIEDVIKDHVALSEREVDTEMVYLAQKTIQKILKGSYVASPNMEKLFYDSDRYTQLKHASSGQQEAIWITYLAFLFILQKQRVFVVFEEPEAHLYPEAQREMVRILVLLLQMQGNAGIITTHSPYILSAINNHLYAHRLGQRHPETVGALFSPAEWLNTAETQAFFLDNGILEDIMDDELEQIRNEAIDSASNIINQEYDALFDLDDV